MDEVPARSAGAARSRSAAALRASAAAALAGLLGACSEAGAEDPAADAGAPPPVASAAAAPSIDELRALLERGDLEEARARLSARVARSPDDGEAHVLLSRAARRLGDDERAEEHGERATELLPESSEAWLVRARALGQSMVDGGMLAGMRRLGPFRDALERAIELDPRNVDARSDQIAFFLVAPGIAGGDVERGLELARELVEIDPARGVPLLAWALAADGRLGEAVSLCEETLAADPDAHEARLALAGLHRDAERFDEAAAAYDAVLAGPRTRTYHAALYQRAKLRIETGGDADAAVRELQEYLADAVPDGRELPPRAGAWWRIGNAEELRGRPDAARAAYERALELDPDFEPARESLEALADD